MALWRDRRGRFSPLRAATLALLIAPFLALLWFTFNHQLGPRARTEAIHEVGLWSIRFLLLSLFVTPMRRIARYAPLVDVRRMLGVGCFAYIALHFTLYMADQMFDLGKVVSEVVLRYYLTIGFTAWVGLAVLAATSNNYMVRQLGGIRWRRLHQLVFPVAAMETGNPVRLFVRALQLARGHYWRLLAFILTVFIALGVIAAAVQLGVGSLVLLVVGRPNPGSLSALLLGLVAGAVQAVFTVVVAVMQARIYVQLAGDGEAQASVPSSGT